MENPKIYSESDELQNRRISSMIEEFNVNLMNICGKCMDIGCGPGNITKEILLPALGSNAQMIGTDISENMIKYANETFSDKKRLQFEVLDIETKNLPKEYISGFDYIFSFHTLQWCHDIRQAFKNIYQMLRPNGFILLNMVISQGIFDVLKILAQEVRFTQYIPDMKNIVPYKESNNIRKDLKELIQDVGFSIHHCSLREECYFEEKSGPFLSTFLHSIISILPFLEDMPQNLMEEFKNTIVHEYMKKSHYKLIRNNHELILHESKVLLVYAQKM